MNQLTLDRVKDKGQHPLEKIIMSFFLVYMITYHIFSFKSDSVAISEVLLMTLLGFIGLYLLSINKFFIGQYFWFLVIYWLWAAATFFWAPEQLVTFSKILSVAQLCVVSYILFLYLNTKNKIDQALRMLMYAFIALAVYTIFFYGLDNLLNGKVSERIGDEISQVNVLGMSLASGALMCFYYAYYFNKRVYYFFCSGIAILSSFTGSRKALVVLVVGILFLLYMKNKTKKILKTIGSILLVSAVVFFILQLPMFELVLSRMTTFFALFNNSGKVDHSAIMREDMISLGWNLFLNNPLAGHGFDSFRYFLVNESGRYTYSHNNYIEMLVNGGIVAFVIYYGMYAFCLINLIRISNKNNTAVILVALLVAQLAGDIAVVSYYSKITFVYFAIAFAYIRIINGETLDRKSQKIGVDKKRESK